MVPASVQIKALRATVISLEPAITQRLSIVLAVAWFSFFAGTRSLHAATILFPTPGFPQAGPTTINQSSGLIDVCGSINGGVIRVNPDNTGDTLDYLKFEVLSTSTVRIEMQAGFVRHLLGAFLGVSTEFGFPPGFPYYLSTPCASDGCVAIPREHSASGDAYVEGSLLAGIYVLSTGESRSTSYDIGDGFTPVNPEGGGFIVDIYTYQIRGDVRGLEFYDGNLNGTFTVTSIPEPTAAVYIGGSAFLLLWQRKANSRKQNKAIQRTR
jgi:hypothetical protein